MDWLAPALYPGGLSAQPLQEQSQTCLLPMWSRVSALPRTGEAIWAPGTVPTCLHSGLWDVSWLTVPSLWHTLCFL